MENYTPEQETRIIFNKLHSKDKLSWITLTELVKKYIGITNAILVTPPSNRRALESIFVKEGGKTKDVLYWQEFLAIARGILAQAEAKVSRDVITTVHNYQGISNGDTFKYSVAKLQDTILPIIHKPAIMRLNHVKFEEQRQWNECLQALIDENIDVALHNYPTALAYMSDPDVKKDIFFWPFFTFHGYAIFARKSSLEKYCKNNDLNCISYVDLQRKGKDAVSGFFQASEIVVERFTDAEFALKDYTAKYQTNWDTLKIKDEPINEGKRKFKEFGFGDILCTNSLHVLDLENVADRFELMDKGDGMTRHKNFNGLICTMDFYRDHDELIKGLINSWFGCMKDTMQEWNIIKSASHLVDGDINYFIYQSLLNYLEEVTFSDKIPLEKFIKSFANNNEFFQDAHTAFERFMKMHNNTRDMERNWEIADIQNKGKVGRDRNEVIAKMLQNMNHVSKYILK